MRLFARRYLLLLLLLVLPVLFYRPVDAQRDPWYTTATVSPDGPVWSTFPGIEISAEGAGIPQIAAAPNGDLMIVYNHWVNGRTDRDPYFAVSFNSGQSWTDGIPIATSANVDSLQLDVTYDNNNNAHVVWVELANNNFQLKYSQSSSASPGVWGTNRTISNVASSNPLMASPSIFASGSNTLDVVWVEADQNNGFNPTLDVYHARSVDNGSSWTKTGTVISNLFPTSQNPDLFVDGSGIVYIAWEEAAPLGASDIRFVKSDAPPNSASVTWTEIDSPLNSLDSAITQAQQPALTFDSGQFYVAFTDLRDNGDTQTVVMARCATNCTAIANWSLQTISGEAVGVNSADPFSVVPQITRGNDTVFVYFHGTDPGLVDENEVIWGMNQCENWAAFGRDQVTPTNIRSINPAIATTAGKLHLAYELVTPGSPSEIHQIHYMSGDFDCQHFVFLPIVNRR